MYPNSEKKKEKKKFPFSIEPFVRAFAKRMENSPPPPLHRFDLIFHMARPNFECWRSPRPEIEIVGRRSDSMLRFQDF